MNWKPEPHTEENRIRRCEAFYRCVKQRLRLSDLTFTPIDSSWGYLIHETVNHRTGSELHSPHEALALLRVLKTG